MSTATLNLPAADDRDLIAAFVALHTAHVRPRPAFVAELRARLLAEISHLDQARMEVIPDATTDAACLIDAGLRGLRGPAESERHAGWAGRDPDQPTGGGRTARADGAGK